ncbi:hypothetical protein, partial [Enterocloster hominis (ex Hitch et al. 2024)]
MNHMEMEYSSPIPAAANTQQGKREAEGGRRPSCPGDIWSGSAGLRGRDAKTEGGFGALHAQIRLPMEGQASS